MTLTKDWEDRQTLAFSFSHPQSSTLSLIKIEFVLVARLITDSKFARGKFMETFNPCCIRRVEEAPTCVGCSQPFNVGNHSSVGNEKVESQRS